MQIKRTFKFSVIATALSLGLSACGGDINLTSDVDDSTGDTSIVNNNTYEGDVGTIEPTDPGSPVVELPGTADSALSAALSTSLGYTVQVQKISGSITEDTTLYASSGGVPVMYTVDGALQVGTGSTGTDASSSRSITATAKGRVEADDVVLTVEAGAVLFGQAGADYIVIHRNAKIMAEGTAAAPIVMTSLQDVQGEETAAGQWGGLVILGNAPSNKCGDDLASCSLQVEGAVVGAVFGGDDWEDDSGVLKYVVVKFAGYEIKTDNELNGITFGGVGSGTTVDYIQVHDNADDGVEFFGGAVNAKHLVLTGNKDDSVDWDNGFKGKLQHVYIAHAKNNGEADRAIEADNDGTTPDKGPQSNPTIANMTIIGNDFTTEGKASEGIYLREGTAAKIYNTVITGSNGMGECLEFEGGDSSVTVANANSGKIVMQNVVMACTNGENFKDAKAGDDTVSLDLEAWFSNETSNSIRTSILIGQSGIPDSGSSLIVAGAGQDVSASDSFFDATDYVGALDGATDWRDGWAYGFGGAVINDPVEATSCPEGTSSITTIDGTTNTCEISGTISSDLTLTADNLYALSGPVFVGGDKVDSATLTIEAGTTVYGASGNDYLVVSRDSKIEAVGTQDAPITFTSTEDITGEATSAGQWGGIVLLGNAQSNKCPTDGSDCSLKVEGVGEGANFGGTDDEDSSGTLRYVVVKHAGFEIETDNELNGITFAAIGSGTKVEYIQIHENADDGIEFFGGTVNAKYVVLTANQDDSVDWDNGYRGTIQHVLVKHDSADGAANRAIEADNDSSNPTVTPQSNPTIANMTIIGNAFDGDDDSEGIYLREGTKAQLHNFVVTNAAGECLELEAGTTADQAVAGDTVISNSVFACSENFKDSTTTDTAVFGLEDWVLNLNDDNSTAANMAAVLNGVLTIDTTTPKDFTGDTFLDVTDHIGAVSADNDWTKNWTVGLED